MPRREATKVLWWTCHRCGDNGATGDLGSDGHRKAVEAMGDAGGAADGVLVVRSMGSSNWRAGPFPPWTPVSPGQQSAVRPADGDRPDEKTPDGQVGVGDDVTAADLGPDPDAATRLSLNELAGMDCNRHGDCKQYRERCPFVDEPAVCVRHDSLASQSSRDWLTLRGPPTTDTPVVSQYNSGARRGWASGDARESSRQPSRSCTASQADTSGGVATTITTRSDWTPTWMGVPGDEGAK